LSINTYSYVTETPGSFATKEQLSMILTRYNLAKKYCENKDVLEVACGSGIGISYLNEIAKSVSACDIDSTLVNITKNNIKNIENVDVKVGDAQNLPYLDKSFDVVIIFEAIYYLDDFKKFLDEANRVLRAEGLIIISSVNPEWHGFNPSPFSTKYFNLDELNSFSNSLLPFKNLCSFYGYNNKINYSNFLISIIKILAVKLNIMPKTMSGKKILKKIFLGKLYTIPNHIDDKMCKLEKLILSTKILTSEKKNFKQIYTVLKKK